MTGSRVMLRSVAAQLARACNSGGSSGGLSAVMQPAWQQLASSSAATLLLATDALAVTAAAGAGAARPYWAAAATAGSSGLAHAVGGDSAGQRRWRSSGQGMLPPPPPPPVGQGCQALPPPSPHQAMFDRNLLVDTLDTARRLEALGLTRGQAEALTLHLTAILVNNKEKLEEFYASKVALDMSILEQEAKHAGFRSEVLKSQELQVATFTRDTERLQINLEKIRSEIRYEIDKLTASQRLDLNLEKGRMRDELQMLRDKSNELEIKMDKEVNSLKAAMEQSKNDTVKYVLGLMLALMTAGLGAARLLMH